MIAFLILTLGIVFAGMFGAIRWLAIVGTCLLLLAYLVCLAEGRRARKQWFER